MYIAIGKIAERSGMFSANVVEYAGVPVSHRGVLLPSVMMWVGLPLTVPLGNVARPITSWRR